MAYSRTEICGAILQLIEAFRSGGLPLHEVATRLDVGLSMLVDMDIEWMKTARRKWSVIEEVNAVTLDRPDRQLSAANRDIALQAAHDLQDMIDGALLNGSTCHED
jgi:hypothetical protein